MAAQGESKLSYMPEPHEQAYYQALFQVADTKKAGSIGGAEAVQFFARSKLPVDALRSIWTVADQPSTNALDLRKFAVAVRLIQLLQNGTKGEGPTLKAPPGVALKPVMFEGVSGTMIPLPQAPSQPAGVPSSGASVGSVPPPTPPRPPAPPGPSMALTPQDPYTLTPQDQSRYDALFPQHAKPDGFVYGPEAVALFSKSGVPQSQLGAIWNMVDYPADSRLDAIEFAIAMHLIVCVSRKNLPLPPSLPMSLKQLKSQASSSPKAPVPSSGASVVSEAPSLGPPSVVQAPAPLQGVPPPPPPPAPAASGPPPLQGPPPLEPRGGMSISDAFEGLGGGVDTGSYAASAPPVVASASFDSGIPDPEPVAPPSPAPRSMPTPMVEPTPVAAPPAPSTTQLASNYSQGDSHQELDKMKAVLQKLQAENISLKAQLGTLGDDEKQVQKELHATVDEIGRLSQVLTTLRAQVVAAKSKLLESTAELKAAQEKKGVISDLITETTEVKKVMEQAHVGMEKALDMATAPPPAPPAPVQFDEADLFGFGGPVASSASEPIAEEDPVPEPVVSEATANASDAVAPAAPSEPSYPSYRYSQPPMAAMDQKPATLHTRDESTASALDFGAPMGSGIPGYSLSLESDNGPPAVETVMSNEELDELKRRAREADDIARDAEASQKQLTAQVDELRKLADAADAEARQSQQSAAAAPKKRGMLGRGKSKTKKDMKEVEKLAADAKAKKQQLMQAESQKHDAEALATETRREADRLRNEAEEAEMMAASAASRQQMAGSGSNGFAAHSTNGTFDYGQAKVQQAAQPPQFSYDPSYSPADVPTGVGGLQNSGFPPPNPSVMGSGNGISIPTPMGDSDPYSNPFG